jgi:hypothetical protein
MAQTYCVLSRGAELLTLKTAVIFNDIQHFNTGEKMLGLLLPSN